MRYQQRVNPQIKSNLDNLSVKLKLPKINVIDLQVKMSPEIVSHQILNIPKSKDKKIILITKQEYLLKNGNARNY